jgi:hypothetical protein
MRTETVLVPEHILRLVDAGHDPCQVKELLETYLLLEEGLRRRRRSRPARVPGEVVPLFPGAGEETDPTP